MNPAFVLDCSVAMAWCFEDEIDPFADWVLENLPTAKPIVPILWHLETANALLVAARRKRIAPEHVAEGAFFLGGIGVIDDPGSVAQAIGDILGLAQSCNLSAYDAAYLELALRLGLPLATLDRKLKDAAKSAGVGLLTKA